MHEYINRETLKRYFQRQRGASLHKDDVVAAIANAPECDVAEVVRCKNCKYLMFSDCYGECSKGYLGIVSPDDYCSRGERKAKERLTISDFPKMKRRS